MGGMLGESKFDVQMRLPAELSPKTILIRLPISAGEFMTKVREEFQLPVIVKPDFGERGWMVKKIYDENDAQDYLRQINTDFLVQDFVDLPLEFGVFYARYPSEKSGRVVSIVGKEMLFVTGDGRKTIRELILDKDRSKLQWDTLKRTYHERLNEVLPSGEKLELVSIGNHCLGTKFLNCNDLISGKLSDSFDRISKEVGGFYFGRYDLRTASVEDLENGKVSVVELNGCGAEPAHIYDPDFSFWQAWRVLYQHWTYIYRISRENHALGVPYVSFKEGMGIYRKFKSVTAQ